MSEPSDELHYRHPPAKAYQLNKLLYRVRMDAAVRQAFIDNPDDVMAEYELNADEREAARVLDVNRLSSLGAHPLLGFMARFNVERDRRKQTDSEARA
jgi:2,3-dihydroxyphenylpropionate 1,2-dioxygenase